jgi:hypothetical protein
MLCPVYPPKRTAKRDVALFGVEQSLIQFGPQAAQPPGPVRGRQGVLGSDGRVLLYPDP